MLHSCICHSPTHPPTHPLTHPPTHPLTHSPTHSLTHPLTHSPTHPLTHPLTHSPTHPIPTGSYSVTYCTSTNMLRLIAFSTSLITILGNVFTTLRHSRYKEFVKQVGRTIRYILPYNILTHPHTHKHTRSLTHSFTHTHSHTHSLTLSMFSIGL